MKTLIVPLDGSPVAEQVLPHVKWLATLLTARVRLLQVISNEEVAGVLSHDGHVLRELGDPSLSDAVDAQRVGDLLRQRAVDYLGARAAELHDAGVPADIVVHEGSPAEQIVSLAEGDHEALIAMATHGYSGLRRWALGSVADKVLHIAKTPVFLMRAATQPPTIRPCKRILVPLDGSANAEQALPPAIELARAARAELILLQVAVPLIEYVPGLSPFNRPLAPSIKFPEFLREQAQQQLAATIDRFGASEVAMTPVAMFGYPAEAIVDEASARQADLIVMATHGYGGLRRWALGRVADKVLHASAVPLLLVRSCASSPAWPE
ncbi:MAG TPA: universal stress protein [Roseiflexaceae bacterium]|nr:universal stress protein [Roseiflexaceae bacterium]